MNTARSVVPGGTAETSGSATGAICAAMISRACSTGAFAVRHVALDAGQLRAVVGDVEQPRLDLASRRRAPRRPAPAALARGGRTSAAGRRTAPRPGKRSARSAPRLSPRAAPSLSGSATSSPPSWPRSPPNSSFTREFPPEVLGEAESAVAAGYRLPETRLDGDPVRHDRATEGATDLDQALRDRARRRRVAGLVRDRRPPRIRRTGRRDRCRGTFARSDSLRGGWPHPVAPAGGSAKVPPRCCRMRSAARSSGSFRLDPTGRATSATVTRARVRFGAAVELRRRRRRAGVDGGEAAMLGLLREVGERRAGPRERARGGASLATPEILVTRGDGAGHLWPEASRHAARRVLERPTVAA